MAYYAFLNEHNVVTEVISGIDENQLIEGKDPETWYGEFRGQTCKRTSFNHNIRKQFAGLGYSYDPNDDVFIAPQPYPSWTLDSNHDWPPPVPRPADDALYLWDEDAQQWVAQ